MEKDVTGADLEERGEYFDACESEELSHQSLGEAIDEVLSGRAEEDGPPDEPLEVMVYTRGRWTDSKTDPLREAAIIGMFESFDNEIYTAHPDHGVADALDKAQQDQLDEAAKVLVDTFCQMAKPWSCDYIGTITVLVKELQERWEESSI